MEIIFITPLALHHGVPLHLGVPEVCGRETRVRGGRRERSTAEGRRRRGSGSRPVGGAPPGTLAAYSERGWPRDYEGLSAGSELGPRPTPAVPRSVC